MAIVPPTQQARPTITWSIVLRVEPGFDCVSEAVALATLPPGSSVVLDVDHRPHDVDPRVVELVRSAWQSRGLRLDVRGAVGPVGAWWRELTQSRAESPRRLQVVQGGADA